MRSMVTGWFMWARDGLLRLAGQKFRQQWALNHTLQRYTRMISGQHSRLIVPGRAIDLSLDKCYIPLELRSGQVAGGDQILNRSGAVLILGDPGSGKSALMSRYVRTLCQNAQESRRRARIPVYVPLFELRERINTESIATLTSEQAFDLLNTWLRSTLTAQRLYDAQDFLSAMAHSAENGVVVLLDGLDELDALSVSQIEIFVLRLIEYLRNAPGRNLVVLGSRPQALEFAPRLIRTEGIRTVELQKFSPAAIYSFLLRWPYGSHLDPTKEAQRIFAKLRRSATLFDACSNPLSLALYISRDLRRQQTGVYDEAEIIDTRAEFFTEILGYLLVRRRTHREGAPTPNFTFRQSRFDYFAAVARDHIASDEAFNRMSATHLTANIGSLVPEGKGIDETVVAIAQETGLVKLNEDGTWSFIHRSFLDYFLALSLATAQSNKQISRLLTLLNKSPLRYEEGFYLACGLMASRSWPRLPELLKQLGDNAFVGSHYPRACLEAQAYSVPDFADRIRFYCARWKREKTDKQLLHDLVSVLIDYERSCRVLGRGAEVSFAGQLWPSLKDEGYSLLQAVQLDVELGMTVLGQRDVSSVIQSSPTEEAVIALYDPNVARALEMSSFRSDPRLAAIMAESALRSSLLAIDLSREDPHMLSIKDTQEQWPQAWPIRNSKYAAVLSHALPYIRALPPPQRAEFPHLSLLADTKPIRRLRFDLAVGDFRVTLVAASFVFAILLPFLIAGESPLVVGGIAIGLLALLVIVARLLVLRRRLTLASSRILNLQPVRSDVGSSLGNRICIVNGSASELRRVTFRRPSSGDGDFVAVYDRSIPLVWRRYCPQLGSARLPRSACAVLQHVWTEDIRQIVKVVA